jgi:hypothetical protein
MKEREYLEEVGSDGRIILKWVLKKSFGRECTVLIWLKTGTTGEML